MRVLLITFVATVIGAGSSGAATYSVDLDTLALAQSASGPFSMDFQLVDGSGSAMGMSSVVLSEFDFGGGGVLDRPITFGTVAGDTASQVMLSTGSFLNEFRQQFIPGSQLHFDVSVTGAMIPSQIPDEFTLALLDGNGVEIPTLGPADSLLVSDVTSGSPALVSYGSDPSRTLSTGVAVAVPQPSVSVQAAPEPSCLILLGSAGVALGWYRRSKSSNTSADVSKC